MKLCFVRKNKLLVKVVIIVALVFLLVYLVDFFLSDTKGWVRYTIIQVGQLVKVLSPTLYKYFKSLRQANVLKRFEREAQLDTDTLHVASGWWYLSEEQFNSIVDHVLAQIPIRDGDSIFELGCGVGAVLQRIRHVYGTNISLGGSDISGQAIKKVRKVFPKEVLNFYVVSMTQKNEFLADSSQDHVVSFGAFAMYLYEDQMEVALQEAIRITKPGGHMCFTHFTEPNGKFMGSILEPIEKSHWSTIVKRYSLENLRVIQMLHQMDRYFVCFSKKH